MAGHLSISLSEYSARIRFCGAGRLAPDIGATLRGGFGKALKDICCVHTGTKCPECLLGWRCAYGYLFETPVPPDSPMMRRYTHAPHPFVLRPPLDHSAQIEAGATMGLTFLMIGRAVDYFPYMVMALMRLGELGLGRERVAFELDEIRVHPSGTVVYERGQKGPVLPAESARTCIAQGDVREGRFRLDHLTPLRLRVEDHVLRKPDFAPLVSAALRRLQLLCHVHDQGDFSLDAADLAEQARSVRLVKDATCWHDGARYSRRQGRSMPMGGLTGSATFEGDIGAFGPLLELAGRVHVGRGTAFGHGRFRVQEDGEHGQPS